MLNIDEIGLQFFAEGGAEGGDGSEGGNGLTGDFDADYAKYFGKGGSSSAAGSTNGEKSAEETASAAAPETETEAASSGQQDDDEAEYQMLRTKHQKRLQADMQKSFNGRFKQFKETESALNAEIKRYKNTIAPLYDKYGLDGDAPLEDMADAIKKDNTVFSRQAMAAGMSTDAYRDQYYTNLEQQRQQAEQQAAQQEQAAQAAEQQRQQAMQETYNRWQAETDELKKTFPNFDLTAEIKGNEAFRKALEAGLPVSQAYYGSNFEKISSGLVAAASQDAARKTAQTVAANRARPSEGGVSAGTGIKTGAVDVAHMTDDQIEAIKEQVKRGAIFTFR